MLILSSTMIIILSVFSKSGGEIFSNITKRYSIDNGKQAVDIICNSCINHPGISKIRSTITEKENTNVSTIFSPVNSDEVKQCLQKLNPRKAISQHKVPPVLIKMLLSL